MDDFYRLTKDHEKIMRECKDLALEVFIERKDEHYRRISDPTSFDDLLKIFAESTMHWVFIKRKREQNPVGHYVKQENGEWKKYETYYEVGGCTMAHKDGFDYFLFIYMTEEVGDKFVKKYKLKLLK